VIRALVLLALCVSAAAHADTRRIAVVVGNNAGGPGDPALHYAESDASKVARVLTELGGVAPADMFLVEGRGSDALERVLARARAQVTAAHAVPATRVILIFYFSGHSDGEALELGGDRYSFAALRHWLADTGADVRLALVDSCKSGALLTAKGGSPAPGFQIRLTDGLASTGEALLTSSAADELALESREIGGSFFTHHFVSGLRGAADASGDGLVTLTEAYQYAYAHTIETTGATIVGPQHPAYDYRLTGQGELVLTVLTRRDAAVSLPRGLTRALVIDAAHDQVVAEVDADGAARIAVAPGRYNIRAWRDGQLRTGAIVVAAGEDRGVAWDDLSIAAPGATRAKGGFGEAPSQILAALGAAGGVASGLGVSFGARIAWRPATSGFAASLDARAGSGDGFRERGATAIAGYQLGLVRGPWRAWVGLGGGIGVVEQLSASNVATGALVAGPWAGASVHVAGPVSLAIEAQLDGALLRRDGATAVIALPGAWFGCAIALPRGL
jgi:hypothetical protein